MHYSSGDLIRVGDFVAIDGGGSGRVIASMDTGEYALGQDSWAYLEVGVMVDTDFAGLVHYIPEYSASLSFLERPHGP